MMSKNPFAHGYDDDQIYSTLALNSNFSPCLVNETSKYVQ